MATFQSRDEVAGAYRDLLKLEQTIQRVLNEEDDDLEWDHLPAIAEKESKLMSMIDDHPELDPLQEDPPDASIRKLLEKFSELRDKNRTLIQSRAEQVENQLESLDQADKLMKHYMQGDKRFGRSMSRRFEREI